MNQIRQFESGATRDADETKMDFEGFYSPLVIESYGRYMHSHRKQADGKLRDSDNWQKGFGENHRAVCMKSLWRHFLDLWKIHRGHKVIDPKDGHEVTLEEACNAILFNVQAILHKELEHEEERR